MNHKLLLAVDGARSSRKTAIYAAQICAGSRTCRGIVVFHVYVAIPPFVEGANPGPADLLAERTDKVRTGAAEKMLANIKEAIIREGVGSELITTELVEKEGDAAKQIIRAAAAHGCDTIVLGRHNKSLFVEFLEGSIVEHILRKPIGYTIWVVE